MISHFDFDQIDELTIDSIPITQHKYWSVLTDFGWLRFNGEPDPQGNLYARHNGDVYCLTIKERG